MRAPTPRRAARRAAPGARQSLCAGGRATHLEEHKVGDHEHKHRHAQDGPHGPVDGGEVHEEGGGEARHQDALSRVHGSRLGSDCAHSADSHIHGKYCCKVSRDVVRVFQSCGAGHACSGRGGRGQARAARAAQRAMGNKAAQAALQERTELRCLSRSSLGPSDVSGKLRRYTFGSTEDGGEVLSSHGRLRTCERMKQMIYPPTTTPRSLILAVFGPVDEFPYRATKRSKYHDVAASASTVHAHFSEANSSHAQWRRSRRGQPRAR